MFTEIEESRCTHDFVAPDEQPQAAICAKCGREPRSADCVDGMIPVRFLSPREWVDVALKVVKL